jgi:hypothetical protein
VDSPINTWSNHLCCSCKSCWAKTSWIRWWNDSKKIFKGDHVLCWSATSKKYSGYDCEYINEINLSYYYLFLTILCL